MLERAARLISGLGRPQCQRERRVEAEGKKDLQLNTFFSVLFNKSNWLYYWVAETSKFNREPV